jgi:hypothetical protein
MIVDQRASVRVVTRLANLDFWLGTFCLLMTIMLQNSPKVSAIVNSGEWVRKPTHWMLGPIPRPPCCVCKVIRPKARL